MFVRSLSLPPFEFGRNFNVKLCPPPNSTPGLAGYGKLGRKWHKSKSCPHIPIRLLYTPYAYLAPFWCNAHLVQLDRRDGLMDGHSSRSNGETPPEGSFA